MVKITGFLLALFMLLVACAPGTPVTTSVPEPTATVIPAGLATPDLWPCEVISPATVTGEILRISGSAPTSSEPIILNTGTQLRVYWNQASRNNFNLRIISQSSAQSGTPAVEVTFEVMSGSSFGCSDYSFPAGEYTLIVDYVDGPWEVWVQTITYTNG